MARFPNLALLAFVAPLLAGCGAYEALKGKQTAPPPQTVPTPKSPAPSKATVAAPDQPRWVLIKNPRYEGKGSEREYIWVEENKIPGTFNTVLFGRDSVLAPREEIAKYGPPPGGGKISPKQGGPPLVASRGATSVRSARPLPELNSEDSAQEVTPRGYVIYIRDRLIAVDLTSVDGVKKGSILSVRRGRIPLTHPVSGEYLGELDEEIATARVVELRERFTVAELLEVRAGYEPKLKDWVVVRPE